MQGRPAYYRIRVSMNSPLNYFGGKSRLADRIVPLIPPHVCYCEPFCGGAWVLFRKDPSKHEVLNDADCELVTFWRVVQNHLAAFMDYYKFAVISRKLFDLERLKNPCTLTDIQRAVRYFYLQRLTFGGKTSDRYFGAGPARPGNLNLSTLEETLLETHWRLQAVTIECLDAIKCIEKYDRPDTFFYIDPPYFNVAQDYAVKFSDADFGRLRTALAVLKGKFVLSLNDDPAVRSWFKGFTMRRVATKYSTGNRINTRPAMAKPRFELLISNA